MRFTCASAFLTLALCSLLFASGCSRETKLESFEEGPLLEDEPLLLRLNDKSQILLYNRWVDLFTEQGTLKNYFRKESERYKQFYQEQGTELIRECKNGVPGNEFLPTEVIIECEPKTKTGSISYTKRVAHEYGFGKFTVRLRGQDEEKPEEEMETQPGG